MARGNSRANSERAGSPEDFKKVAQKAADLGPKTSTEEDYKASLVEHFNDMKDADMGPDGLKDITPEGLEGIAQSVAAESSDIRDQRDEFDRAVEAGGKAMLGGAMDWQDKRKVADLIPLTLSEVQDGLEASDVLENEWDGLRLVGDSGYDDAAVADKEYEDDNSGEPASMRGNSRVDAFFAEWAKGFIKDRIESAASNRDDYDDEVNTIEADHLDVSVEEWLDSRK